MLAFHRSQLGLLANAAMVLSAVLGDEFFNARVEFIRPQAFHRSALRPYLGSPQNSENKAR
jgi:hypothetical protein